MSVIFCYKQQPQPWMYYITPDKITFSGDCCPALVTDLTHLLPFQVISQGAFQKLEYRLYGETVWTELTITYSEVMIEGFYFISYNGSAVTELPCGVYEFRLTAGELWWFEPIMVEDFAITENALSVRDELMTPFKITEQLADTTALIAPCDMILPFMFRTSNVTSGTVTVYMVDEDGTETEITITVSTEIIDGMTYYWHSEEYIYPFLTCGRYYLKIVDGANTYYSVPFVPECDISDIPDGYKVLRDFNGCVIRNDEGEIEYEEASDMPEPIAACDDLIITDIYTGSWDSYDVSDERYYSQEFVLDEQCFVDYIELPTGAWSDPNPDFDLRVSIYNTVAGVPTTSIIDSTNLIHVSDFCSAATENRFYFDLLLSAGDYCMVITYENVTIHNSASKCNFDLNNTNPYIHGGLGYKLKAAAGWSLLNNWDLVSKIVFKSYMI